MRPNEPRCLPFVGRSLCSKTVLLPPTRAPYFSFPPDELPRISRNSFGFHRRANRRQLGQELAEECVRCILLLPRFLSTVRVDDHRGYLYRIIIYFATTWLEECDFSFSRGKEALERVERFSSALIFFAQRFNLPSRKAELVQLYDWMLCNGDNGYIFWKNMC